MISSPHGYEGPFLFSASSSRRAHQPIGLIEASMRGMEELFDQISLERFWNPETGKDLKTPHNVGQNV
tara:strand:- start:5716 stop:5919 length:204 start_codon:yes stop_codon:yes gene_type:complete